MGPKMKAEILRDFFDHFLPALLLGLPPFLLLAWLCSRRTPLSPRARDHLRHAAPLLVLVIAFAEFYCVPCTNPPAAEGDAVGALTIAFGTAFSLALVRKCRGSSRAFGGACLVFYSLFALLIMGGCLKTLFLSGG